MAKKYTAAQKRGQRAKEARARALRYPNPLAPMSAEAIQQQIDQLTAGALTPGKQEIGRARKESQRLSNEAATRTQGLAEAYAKLLAEIAPATDAAYGNARDAQARLAQGFSQQQTASQQADAAHAAELLGRIGAPAAQSAQVQGMGAGVGNVSYGLGGYIPSTALNEAGAAFGAQARQLPAYALGRGQQNVAALRKAQQVREKELDDKLADLMGQVPGLRAKFYADIAQAENAKEATRIQRKYLKIAAAKQELDEFSTVAGVTGIDPTTGLPTAGAAAAAAKTAGKGKAARQAALDSNRQKAFDRAAVLWEGEEIPNPNKNQRFITPTIQKRPTYEQARRILFAQYGAPLLRLAPPNGKAWWQRQVNAAINAALAQYDFKKTPKPKRNRKLERPGPG